MNRLNIVREATPAAARRRFGIGARLTLAFACIAGLTAVAGGSSSVLSLQSGDIVRDLGARTLPTVTASLSFAQRSSVLASEAPALATEKDAAALDAKAQQLNAMLEDQSRRLDELRGMVDPPALIDPVQKLSTALGAKIGELKPQTAKRIALQAQLNAKVADALGAYQDMMDFVRPLQEATKASVDGLLDGLKGTGGGAAADNFRLADQEIPALRTLMDIQSNGNLAFGMISAAASAPQDDSASDIRTQYNWAELYLNKAVKTFGTGPDAERIAKLSAALLAPGEGGDSVFALREKQAALDADGAVLLQDMVKLSVALSTEVDALVKGQEAAAGSAVSHSGSVTQRSLVVNGVLSGIVLLASMLIGWLYVHRVVMRRLNGLAGRMGRLAAGDRDVTVDTAGGDEITGMAEAVQVFKSNMIRGDDLAAEAARLAEEREVTRQRAEAERAAAAAEQARVVDGLADGLARLAKGDLTCMLDRAFSAEYESLRRDFNGAVGQLKSVMEQIVTHADSLRSGTGEITAATDDLSKRTEQQAASLEETAAALDEITATVRKTSEGATHARDVVGAAKSDAERSGQVVGRAVQAMSGIEKTSGQIGQIIGVIDEIAFQTNLLALNAGVEAARAGDAGRGFAVVASEVRALAQRSADAAKEIKALISASSAEVKQGVDLVGQTGKALERILIQVAEINSIVSDIAASAQEQTTGLNQVNTAVNQMDQVTQKNAAMVEETTAASHSLARDTETLSGLIDRFDVGQPAETAVHRSAYRSPSRPKRAGASLKIVGRGGATRKAEPASERVVADWEEF